MWYRENCTIIAGKHEYEHSLCLVYLKNLSVPTIQNASPSDYVLPVLLIRMSLLFPISFLEVIS